jgi:hypothetical protein
VVVVVVVMVVVVLMGVGIALVLDVTTQAPNFACAGHPRGARISAALALEARDLHFLLQPCTFIFDASHSGCKKSII